MYLPCSATPLLPRRVAVHVFRIMMRSVRSHRNEGVLRGVYTWISYENLIDLSIPPASRKIGPVEKNSKHLNTYRAEASASSYRVVGRQRFGFAFPGLWHLEEKTWAEKTELDHTEYWCFRSSVLVFAIDRHSCWQMKQREDGTILLVESGDCYRLSGKWWASYRVSLGSRVVVWFSINYFPPMSNVTTHYQ